MTNLEQFWKKVDVQMGNCWEWSGEKNPDGYGRLTLNGKRLLAHRVSYEICVGRIPAGLTIDHLCRNTSCVHPLHLEPVSLKENQRRGLAGWKISNAKKLGAAHCLRGHPRSPENTHIRSDGTRYCRVCEGENQRRRKKGLPPLLRAGKKQPKTTQTFSDRFWSKVSFQPGNCWEWMGTITKFGYGCIGKENSIISAHRYSYESSIGPIPEGMVIHHECENHLCVNPLHLIPITQKTHGVMASTEETFILGRKLGAGASAAKKRQSMVCKRGHSLSDSNVGIRKNGTRCCKACDTLRHKLSRQMDTP